MLECEKSFLESFGYTVLTASSGRKGLDLASVHPVDVVIVDYVMPEMNGQEVAIEMKRLRPHAPIIMMLSGTADVPRNERESEGIRRRRLTKQRSQRRVKINFTDSGKGLRIV